MLPSPSSSPAPRLPLQTRTNVNVTHTPYKISSFFFPTPPQADDKKRKSIVNLEVPQKRVKLDLQGPLFQSSRENNDSDEDEEIVDVVVIDARARRRTPFQMHNAFMSRLVGIPRRHELPTAALLQSFVSSKKSDVFTCQSIDVAGYLTPPYACAYSYGAKSGKIPLLAVATEQGSVHIFNTSKRRDWDHEPQRTTLQPHANGIFDVKWNKTDTHLATSSGDRSTRICDIEHNSITHVLRGHSKTVKSSVWDPRNSDILITGGRDNNICVWDLRAAQKSGEDGIQGSTPVMIIASAHGDDGKIKPQRGKAKSESRSVTNVLYPESEPYGIVSSGSSDGILKFWDLRMLDSPQKSKTKKRNITQPLYLSSMDPTSLYGSKRSRGIISLACGTGPTAGLVFGLGADSRIHSFILPTLTPHKIDFAHSNMLANSFYVSVSVSPCGRWLASGNSTTTNTKGNLFLFDIANASRPSFSSQPGIELSGQDGEVGALDWAQDMLATCADDGTVRIWRPDIEIYRQCQEDPEEKKWDWDWVA